MATTNQQEARPILTTPQPVSLEVMVNPETSELLPTHEEASAGPGNFAVGFFDKCCAMDGPCFMAWFCPCIAVGQMYEKLKQAGLTVDLNYGRVVTLFIILLIIGAVWDVLTEPASMRYHDDDDGLWTASHMTNLSSAFIIIAVFILRRRVRTLYRIGGGTCSDFLLSFCCTPCTIRQLVSQLWRDPRAHPGCGVDSSEAHWV